MNGDFLDALQQIAREKEISPEALLETVEQALVTAYKKNFTSSATPHSGEIKVRINSAKATFQDIAITKFIDLSSTELLKAVSLGRNLGHSLTNITTVNMDFLTHYRPMTNVVRRPTQKGGKGYALTGHHEIMVPLLAAAVIEELSGR